MVVWRCNAESSWKLTTSPLKPNGPYKPLRYIIMPWLIQVKAMDHYIILQLYAARYLVHGYMNTKDIPTKCQDLNATPLKHFQPHYEAPPSPHSNHQPSNRSPSTRLQQFTSHIQRECPRRNRMCLRRTHFQKRTTRSRDNFHPMG